MASRDFDTVAELADVEPDGFREELYNLFSMSANLARKFGKELRKHLVD